MSDPRPALEVCIKGWMRCRRSASFHQYNFHQYKKAFGSTRLVLLTTTLDMWQLVQILSASQLWFSDGNSIETIRGGRGISSRLIVDGQGFLDVTEVHIPGALALDANGATLWLKRHGRSGDTPECPYLGSSSSPLSLSLGVDNDGTFDLNFAQLPGCMAGWMIILRKTCLHVQTDSEQLVIALRSRHRVASSLCLPFLLGMPPSLAT